MLSTLLTRRMATAMKALKSSNNPCTLKSLFSVDCWLKHRTLLFRRSLFWKDGPEGRVGSLAP